MFIVVDQLRADCVTGALAGHIQLPNIQALRRDAVTFSNHFSVVNPCGPARASLLTGLYAMNHRSVRNGTPLARSTPNLALEARKSGYEPLLFGYTDTAQDPREFHPNDPAVANEEMVLPGFYEVLEMRAQRSLPWRAHLKSKGYELPDFAEFYYPVPSEPRQPTRLDDPAFYAAEDSDTAFLTDELLKHLSVRTDQSWFAHATYYRPHPPLVAPAPYNKMYDPAQMPMPERLETRAAEAAVHPFLGAALNRPGIEDIVKGFDGRLDPDNDAHVQALRATYFGLASEVDTHLGRVISFLKDTGQYDNTIIVFTADHGETLGNHHMWGKQNIYDVSFRVPLIIRDPRARGQFGTSVDAFTESVDVTPTLLDLIGQGGVASMDGASLRPYLQGETPENWREFVHLELDFGEPHKLTVWQKATGCSFHEANLAILRDADFKLVHFNGGLAPLLFDMGDDPHELHNLADDPAHMATVLRLTQKLLNFRMAHGNRILSDQKITTGGVVSHAAT